MPSQLIDPVCEGLARALDVHRRHHEAPVSNPANAETPGFGGGE